MKGNTIVRKMRKLGNIIGQCMEDGQNMKYDGSTRKDFNRVSLKMARAERKLNNIWRYNVPRCVAKYDVDALVGR